MWNISAYFLCIFNINMPFDTHNNISTESFVMLTKVLFLFSILHFILLRKRASCFTLISLIQASSLECVIIFFSHFQAKSYVAGTCTFNSQ